MSCVAFPSGERGSWDDMLDPATGRTWHPKWRAGIESVLAPCDDGNWAFDSPCQVGRRMTAAEEAAWRKG